MEDKRRLENRITQLEEDLEEEQMTSETSNDKSRKALQQVTPVCVCVCCVCVCVCVCVCMCVYTCLSVSLYGKYVISLLSNC